MIESLKYIWVKVILCFNWLSFSLGFFLFLKFTLFQHRNISSLSDGIFHQESTSSIFQTIPNNVSCILLMCDLVSPLLNWVLFTFRLSHLRNWNLILRFFILAGKSFSWIIVENNSCDSNSYGTTWKNAFDFVSHTLIWLIVVLVAHWCFHHFDILSNSWSLANLSHGSVGEPSVANTHWGRKKRRLKVFILWFHFNLELYHILFIKCFSKKLIVNRNDLNINYKR